LTFNEILDRLTDSSAFNTDFDKDVKILSTINKIKNASVGTKMYSKIDALMIVNNLCHESIQIHDYKQTIIEEIINYFNTQQKIRIITIIAQYSRENMESISNYIDNGNQMVIIDPF